MKPAVDRRQWVTPEDLNLAPEVLGLPLASPGRRAAAMLIDLCVIAVVSALANFWWLCAGALLGVDHARRQQPGRRPWRRWWVWAAAAALLAAGVLQSWDEHSRPRRPRALRVVPGEVPASGAATGLVDEEDDDDEDAAVARAARQALAAAAAASAVSAAMAASAVAHDAAAAAMGLAMARQGERIHKLEAQLAEARARRSLDPRVWLRRWADELGLGYGFSMLYFSLLPAWWGGQTVGKRLLRLRVVELTAKPMTALRCLKRFGGYAAGMATGGLGFVQVLWDPNRQAIQDKTAHTAVVDLRRPRLILDPGGGAAGALAMPRPGPETDIGPGTAATTSPPPATTSPPQ